MSFARPSVENDPGIQLSIEEYPPGGRGRRQISASPVSRQRLLRYSTITGKVPPRIVRGRSAQRLPKLAKLWPTWLSARQTYSKSGQIRSNLVQLRPSSTKIGHMLALMREISPKCSGEYLSSKCGVVSERLSSPARRRSAVEHMFSISPGGGGKIRCQRSMRSRRVLLCT